MFTQKDGRDKLESLKKHLSVKQEDAYNHVRWLISGNRHDTGTGRSYLLAVLYIEEAINNPNETVYLVDHNVFNRGIYSLMPDNYLKDIIRKLCVGHNITMYISIKDNWIRFTPQENRRILPDRRMS